MNLDKLRLDRKLLKVIDFRLVQFTTLQSFGFLVAFGVLVFSEMLLVQHLHFLVSIGLILTLFAVHQVYILLTFEGSYCKRPLRWRQRFLFVVYLHYTCFALLSFISLLNVALHEMRWVYSLLVVIFTILGSSVWTPYRRVNEVLVSLLLVPIIFGLLCSLYLDTKPVPLLMGVSVLSAIYVYFLLKAKDGDEQYWHSIQRNFALKEKTKDIESLEQKIVSLSDKNLDVFSELSQEIKIPMNSILGVLTLLSDQDLTVEQKEIVDIAQHSGNSMMELVDDFLDYSLVTTGQVALVSAVFNCRNCLGEALEPLGPMAHEKNIELSIIYDEDVPLRVQGDSLKIGQILSNLVGNAIKYSQEGEVVVTVHMSYIGSQKGMLRFHIMDQGVGVDADQREDLFRAFHRADAVSNRKSCGVGLGLAISKGLAELMNGEIGLLSNDGCGSTFWFTAEVQLSTQQVSNYKVKKEFSNLRVLIVGGTSGINQSLASELSAWSIESDLIDEGYDKALQLLREAVRLNFQYDLVILNLGHIYKGNIKLLKIILDDPQLTSLRIIVLTTLLQKGLPIFKNIDYGDNHVSLLTKPVQRKLLYETLSRLFSKKKDKVGKVFSAKKKEVEANNLRLLLIDDNSVNQLITRGMLKLLGCEVKIVESESAALALLADTEFDLILVSCCTKGLNGFMTSLLIRKSEIEHGGSRHIPIVGISETISSDEQTKCLAAGMDSVLYKPLNTDDLSVMLCQVLHLNPVPSGIVVNQN